MSDDGRDLEVGDELLRDLRCRLPVALVVTVDDLEAMPIDAAILVDFVDGELDA